MNSQKSKIDQKFVIFVLVMALVGALVVWRANATPEETETSVASSETGHRQATYADPSNLAKGVDADVKTYSYVSHGGELINDTRRIFGSLDGNEPGTCTVNYGLFGSDSQPIAGVVEYDSNNDKTVCSLSTPEASLPAGDYVANINFKPESDTRKIESPFIFFTVN